MATRKPEQQTSPLPQVYKIMTKLGDNPEPKAPRVDDAFAKYSNDVIRLKTILLKDDGFDLQEFASRNYTTAEKMNLSSNNAASKSSPRKTRISFEAHPSLIIDDMLETLQDDGNIDLQDEDDVELFAYLDIPQ